MSKIKNLSKVVKKLHKRKFSRIKEIIRDYGLREFLRRVKEKMQYGDANIHLYERIFVVTNEAYVKNLNNTAKYTSCNKVEFMCAPGADNVGRVDILTDCEVKTEAQITMEIFNREGDCLLKTTETNIKNNDYTTFTFLPVLDVIHHPLKFIFTCNNFCGVLVNKHKSKHGFVLEGGGAVGCKIYTRLDALYVHWQKNNTPTEEMLYKQRHTQFEYTPKISIVVPLYNTPQVFLNDLLDSVVRQSYENWELCLADGSNYDFDVQTPIYSYEDERIKYKKLSKNLGIAGNSNKAIEMATGEYIALLDHDDTLMPHALFENVRLINQDLDYEFIYSDEDKLSADGKRRFDPFFKPDFSPNTLNTFNYITHFAVIKKSLLDEVGYFKSEYNGAQDYDLFLRVCEKAKKVGHIADVLYNWRIAETSVAYNADAKSYTIDAGKAALEDSLKRKGITARVEVAQIDNYFNVVYPTPTDLVSIIIPNKDEKNTLKKAIDSILDKTTYANYEIIIIENNSEKSETFSYYEKLEQNPKIRVVKWSNPFNFSALNNFAATEAKGSLLLFLNNDVSVITPDWIEQMAMYCVQYSIGAVGAKLFYPDDTLQHGGVILKIGEVAGHSHKGTYKYEVGSLGRLTFVNDVSGVTAACVMIRKEVFDEVGGFDEQFAVAFNDVDLCLKIRELGYSIVWTPFAQLYHYESKTRGYEVTPEKQERFRKETDKWLAKWGEKYKSDPFYNINLTSTLEDYSINPYICIHKDF